MVRPYIISEYSLDRTWLDRTPDQFLFHGGIKCRGYHAFISRSEYKGLLFNLVWAKFPYLSLDFNFCRKAAVRNLSGAQVDPTCWNQSMTFSKRPYAIHPIVCEASHECVSQYHYRDGVIDCADGSDEYQSDFNENLCGNLQKHRLSCSVQELHCFPTNHVGTYSGICTDGYARFIFETGKSLADLTCLQRTDESCQFLRNYIRNSSIRNTTLHVYRIPLSSRIPFRSYCDSFWNSQSHFDELPKYCRQGICQPH